MERPPSLKGRFPFSFGVPSYIIPADIATNVRWLRDLVDEIELILFESKEFSNMPSPSDVALFRVLAEEAGPALQRASPAGHRHRIRGCPACAGAPWIPWRGSWT